MGDSHQLSALATKILVYISKKMLDYFSTAMVVANVALSVVSMLLAISNVKLRRQLERLRRSLGNYHSVQL